MLFGAAGGAGDYVPAGVGGPAGVGDEAAKSEARAMIAAFVPTAGEGHAPATPAAPAASPAAAAAAAGGAVGTSSMPAPFN